MDIINSETVVVYDHDDLNTALSENNDYIYVHLGADITMTDGIDIYPGKAQVVIDGIDPRDPSQTVHRLTDDESSSAGDCVRVAAASSVQITIQNINLVGRNYYGMPCVYDVAGNEAVTVSYYNVNYVGPQITWHPRGLTRYVDCNITIATGYSPSNEVAEVSKLEIGGVTTIAHNNTTHPTFRFYNRGGVSMTILEEADVTITSTNDFLITEADLPITLQPRSKLNLTTTEGISNAAGYRVSNFLVDENASFYYTRTSSAGIANTLYVSGTITLNEGADFLMVEDVAAATGSLLYFSAGAQLQLNNPLRFALYNSGASTMARPIYFGGSRNFSFLGNQVNYWRAAIPYPAAGTFADVPPWHWHKDEWASLEMSGSATNAATTINSNNLTPEEQDELPPLSEMVFEQAKVFAVGNLPLAVGKIAGNFHPIKGQTAPGSSVIVSYTLEGTSREYTTQANENGIFSVNVEDDLPVGTEISVAANYRFLFIDVIQLVVLDGLLYIESAPEIITFRFEPIYQNPPILPRTVPDAPVVISDQREPKTQWELWARIEGPLQTASGLILPEATVLVPAGETTPLTLSESFQHVHTDGPYEDPLFPVVWNDNEGVLARITQSIRSGEVYTTKLRWQVRPAATP